MNRTRKQKNRENAQQAIPNSQFSVQMKQAVAKVWERYQGCICDRILILEAATTALGAGEMSEGLRTSAHQEAHKLAGSLGTFGIAKGSEIAREIEQIFQAGVLREGQTQHLQTLIMILRQEIAQKAPQPIADNDPIRS